MSQLATQQERPAETVSSPETLLAWRVHLFHRDRSRLPVVGLVMLFAFFTVWLMFRSPLPAVVAVALLVGATSEYLFPVRYRITTEGVHADALTSRFSLKWKEAKRCVPDPMGIIITPLSAPSRLDAFRGVLLRFAPDGEPGDRASVMAAIERCAPQLMTEESAEGNTQC
jgi:hypothetical protein